MKRPTAVLLALLLIASSPAAAVTTPVVVLGDLVQPGHPGVAPDGTVYFAQHTQGAAGLWKLAPGDTAPSQVYSTTGHAPLIHSVGFDRHGNVYFVAWSNEAPSATITASVVRLTERGDAAVLYEANATLNEDGRVSAGATIETLEVTPSGAAFAATAVVEAGTLTARVLSLRGRAPARELAAVAMRPASNPGLAVNESGVAFLSVMSPDGVRELYEVRPSGARLLHSGPGSQQFLAIGPGGDLYALLRTHAGNPQFGCAESTTYTLLRFAADGTSVGGAPTIASQGTFPGFRATWVPGNSRFRVGPSGEVYFASLLMVGSCPPDPVMAEIAEHQVIRGDADGQEIIETEGPYPTEGVRAGQPGLAVDTSTGSLYIAWESRGTLERIDR